MIRVLDWANHGFFVYYLASNLIYLMLLLIALKTTALHQLKLRSLRLAWFRDSPLMPPITLLMPAHNEEKSIGMAVRNVLDLASSAPS